MNVKRKMALGLGICGSAALLALAGSVPAFAGTQSQYENASDPDTGANVNGNGIWINSTAQTGSITLRKTIKAPQNVTVWQSATSMDTYTFTFTGHTGTAVTETGEKAVPAGAAISAVTLTSQQMQTVQNAHTIAGVNVDTAVSLPAASSYGAAGLYEYDVAETTHSHIQDNAHWNNSQATYKLRVYVVSNNGTLQFEGITLEKITDDAGTAVNKKVPPTTRTTPTNIETGFVFTNKYEGVSDLRVNYTTANTGLADMSAPFYIKVNFTFPEAYDSATATNKITYSDAGGTATNLTVDNSTTASHLVQLNSGQNVYFQNLPVGTTYTIEDASAVSGENTQDVLKDSSNLQYRGSGNWTAKNADVGGTTAPDTTGTDANASGEYGKKYTLGVTGHAPGAIIGSAAGNVANITNTPQDTPPTGFIMDYAPYAFIAAGTLVGIVALASTRRNRSKVVAQHAAAISA